MEVLLSKILKTRRKGSRDRHQHIGLDYLQRLLEAFESPRTGTVSPDSGRYASDKDRPLPEHLTAREGEVLALIAEGLSNREIAVRLFIEVGTVKGYVHNILRKLEVGSRTKAVARARELHLIFGE
jgi:LuxR family maltose regulon positive regulatory protein